VSRHGGTATIGHHPETSTGWIAAARCQDVRVIPFRWLVTQTFAWSGRSRTLSKGFKGTTASSEAFVKLAMVQLMARRLVEYLAS
jgi:transposase